jgi:hypothetical protein
MGRTAILALKIIGDAVSGVKALKATDDAAGRMDTTMRTASIGVGILLAALFALAGSAATAASDLQQSSGAVDSVFASYADGVHAQAETAATDVGLAADQYKALASVLGSQLKNMGVSLEDSGEQTADLIGLGADLSAMFGGTAADAVGALSSLLRGERDPIERYGVSINQAGIDAQKAAMGLDGLTGSADKNADLQATLALLMDQTSDAAGTFAREADTASGAQQRATAGWRDAEAALGEALLPLLVIGADNLATFAHWVGDNDELVLTLAVSLGIMAGAVTTLTAAQWLFNIAAAANPVGLVVLAIALALGILIGAVLLVIKYWDEIVVTAEFAFVGIQNFILDTANEMNDFINVIIDAINWLSRLATGEMALDFGMGVVGQKGPNFAPQIARLERTTGRVSQPSIIRNTNVTVNGALDGSAVAKQIQGLLTAADRKSGDRPAGG